MAVLAKTVDAPSVVATCRRAVEALDSRASGVFSIDLRENADGVPCITEVNAGRLSSGTNLLDLTGKHNMAVTYARVGLGEPVELRETYDMVEDHYMLRDLDAAARAFGTAGEVLGLFRETHADEAVVDGLVALLGRLREDARARKDFAGADRIRDELARLGIVLEDTRDGVRWKRV